MILGDTEASQQIVKPENIFYYSSIINNDSINIELKKSIFVEKIINEWNLRDKNFKEEQYLFRCGTTLVRSEMNSILIYDKQLAIKNFVNTHNINSHCLYLIDGKPFYTFSDKKFMQLLKKITRVKLYGITALSGDAATSIFGSRGQNGAYVITTKSKKPKR